MFRLVMIGGSDADISAAGGMSCEAWLTTRLSPLAEEPAVWSAYTFRAWGATGAALQLVRLPGSNEVVLEQQALTTEQQIIAQVVKELLQRNQLGDLERSRVLLRQHYNLVTEIIEAMP